MFSCESWKRDWKQTTTFEDPSNKQQSRKKQIQNSKTNPRSRERVQNDSWNSNNQLELLLRKTFFVFVVFYFLFFEHSQSETKNQKAFSDLWTLPEWNKNQKAKQQQTRLLFCFVFCFKRNLKTKPEQESVFPTSAFTEERILILFISSSLRTSLFELFILFSLSFFLKRTKQNTILCSNQIQNTILQQKTKLKKKNQQSIFLFYFNQFIMFVLLSCLFEFMTLKQTILTNQTWLFSWFLELF